LAEYDKGMAQLAKEAPDAEAADKADGTAPPAQAPIETRAVKRMTRIAETCK
jgi:hypothetical protein